MPTTLMTPRKKRGYRPFAIGWPLAACLFLIAIGVVLSAGEWAVQRETTKLVTTSRQALQVQALALRETVLRYTHIPYTSAKHPHVTELLRAGAPSAGRIDLLHSVNAYLEDINRRMGTEALYLMAPSGLALAASNWHEPKGKTFVGENYDNRHHFQEAIKGNTVLHYAVGTTTGVPGLFIAAPVFSGKLIVGVMALKLSLREVEDAWKLGLDPVVLIDNHGVIFLSSEPEWLYTGTRPLTAVESQWIETRNQFRLKRPVAPVPWTQERLDSAGELSAPSNIQVASGSATGKYLALTAQLPEYGWTLLSMSNRSPLLQARLIAMAVASLVCLVLLMTLIFWRQRGLRFSELIRNRRELEQRVNERTSELQEAHAFRKAMEDSLLVGMRVRDLEGRIVYLNPAMCEMTGYQSSELIGKLPPYPYWHPDDIEKHWHDNQAAMSGKADQAGFESRLRHRQGHDVYTMVYTAPLIDAAGVHSGWMSSVVDVTTQKRTEEQQRFHIEQMQRTGRLASLGEMASTLAHEINQPLMAMASFASAAKAFAQQHNTPLLMENLDAIQGQAQRAKDIVDRIRVSARQQTPGFAPCSVPAVVANMLALLKFEIRQRKSRVVTHFEEVLPPVMADKVLLEQVVMNLVMNSLQAMQQVAVARRIVTIHAGAQDQWVYIRVSDQGSGIAPQDAVQLFSPFFTTKVDGLGLGLKISRTIVEAHGGRIEHENHANGGAVFTVFLPALNA